jgi:uncharacterized membrane protein YbhN (UPF0104 family)
MANPGSAKPSVEDAVTAEARPSGHGHARLHPRQTLEAARGNLKKSALKLLGFAAGAYLVLRLIPSLRRALEDLERLSWEWVLAAIALEALSETGFVVSWRAIVDPDNLLCREGGRRVDVRAAWAQLGAGTLVPGGSLGGLGVGAWLLHRFGMPTKLIAERQFNLSFLNTAIDALALIIFGIGLATGLLSGKHDLSLTLLPALVAVIGLAAALLIARRAPAYAKRVRPRHPKLASSIETLAAAVDDTKQLLVHRGGFKAVLGAQAYLWLDVAVLWVAFVAIHAHPVPTFAVITLAYIIGALGGSLPLPAGLGTVGGIVGMLIVFGVAHNPAVAAVVVYQAVGLLVPAAGGAVAYLLLRHQLGGAIGEPSADGGEPPAGEPSHAE